MTLIDQIKAEIDTCKTQTEANGGVFPCGENCPCALGAAVIAQDALIKELVEALELTIEAVENMNGQNWAEQYFIDPSDWKGAEAIAKAKAAQ